MSSRCRQNLKYEKFTSLFGRVRHKLRQKACRTCSNIIFPDSTNEIIDPWWCLCCRHFINLPSLTKTFLFQVLKYSLFFFLFKPLFIIALSNPDYHPYRRIFVYTFCLMNICLSLSDDANKIKTLNIERA